MVSAGMSVWDPPPEFQGRGALMKKMPYIHHTHTPTIYTVYMSIVVTHYVCVYIHIYTYIYYSCMVQSAPVCDHHADPVYGRPHGGELLRKDQHLARAVDQQLALEARLRQEEQAVRDAQRQLAEARSVIDTLQDKLQVPVLNGGGGQECQILPQRVEYFCFLPNPLVQKCGGKYHSFPEAKQKS